MNTSTIQHWTKSALAQFVLDKAEESLQWEFKGAGSLGKQNNQKLEITKDVSAMANSVGGTIIYGIAEAKGSDQRPFAERLDPIACVEFSSEWLEQVILTIQPRIDGVKIHAVTDDGNSQLGYYVVEIPQSTTAHQARDYRYYKRFNYMAVPMEDYEVRDVMNRRKHPRVELTFEIVRHTPQSEFGPLPSFNREVQNVVELEATAKNTGHVMVQYLVAKVCIPILLSDRREIARRCDVENLPAVIEHTLDNKKQDRGGMGNPISDVRFEPILPSLDTYVGSIYFDEEYFEKASREFSISWITHADNAPAFVGTVLVKDIVVVDRRKRK